MQGNPHRMHPVFGSLNAFAQDIKTPLKRDFEDTPSIMANYLGKRLVKDKPVLKIMTEV